MARPRRFCLATVAVLLVGGLAGYLGAGSGPAAASAAPNRPSGPDCSRTSVGLTPLSELGTGRYHGYQGGLYPGGSNVPPRRYLHDGRVAASRVRTLSPSGAPSGSGRIVVLSVGMSNTYLEFKSLIQLAGTHPVQSGNFLVAGTLARNPRVELVNGATPNWAAETIVGNEAGYLAILNSDLADAGVTADQVQAVWLDEAIENPSQPFPVDAQQLRAYLTTIDGMLAAHFPNLRLIYISSREYAGYAVSKINPEPYAYDSGFSVKWTIARRIAHHPRLRPWIGWGPYTWADGLIPRRDGLTWACSDFQRDGTHPTSAGAQKVGNMLLHFFSTNKTAKSWFNG